MEVLKGFPAFVVCFTLLMTFWGPHYRYFLRHGQEDGTTRFLSLGLLLLVLFYVYPLKEAWIAATLCGEGGSGLQVLL